MIKASREFQIFAKPGGARCNLGCRYCYYLEKEHLYPKNEFRRMPDDILETYIVQHIKAFPGREINFSWHGGEPMLLGVDYFRKIVAFQKKHRPSNRRITNGMQTNGTLLDEKWCRFLATEGFAVGISLDGPQELHDAYRVTKSGVATQERVMRGYDLLQKHGIAHDILCVVNAENVRHPIRVYRFFKQIGARYISFLPLVEAQPDAPEGVSHRTVPAEAFGAFLCAVFDEWLDRDVGRVRVRIFEEAARSAFGQESALCIFRKCCGDIPVIERNGDIFSCDHHHTRSFGVPLGSCQIAPNITGCAGIPDILDLEAGVVGGYDFSIGIVVFQHGQQGVCCRGSAGKKGQFPDKFAAIHQFMGVCIVQIDDVLIHNPFSFLFMRFVCKVPGYGPHWRSQRESALGNMHI